MVPWKRQEVLITGDAALYYAVQAVLKEHGIDCEGKIVNRNFYGLNARRTVVGTLGENPALENQYYIYVRKADRDQAEYLIRQKRQTNWE